MKKLLLSLGALGISASLPMTVIACSNEKTPTYLNKQIQFKKFLLDFSENKVTDIVKPKWIEIKELLFDDIASFDNLQLTYNGIVADTYTLRGEFSIPYFEVMTFQVNGHLIQYSTTFTFRIKESNEFDFIVKNNDLEEALKQFFEERGERLYDDFYRKYFQLRGRYLNKLENLLTTNLAGEYYFTDYSDNSHKIIDTKTGLEW